MKLSLAANRFPRLLAVRCLPRKTDPLRSRPRPLPQAIHGDKVKNDKVDSEKLALLLRGGNFATAYAYPKELRATRDLLRRLKRILFESQLRMCN